MAMSAEHLLLAGQVDDFQVLLDEVLTLNPEQVEGLRLRARLFAWQRDEAGMYDALAKLATVAREKDSLDDERFALSQLVMIAPHQVEYADRLREINELHGFDDAYDGDNMFDEQFMRAANKSSVSEPELETFATVPAGLADVEEVVDEVSSADFAIVGGPVQSPELSVEIVDTDDPDDEHSRLLREVDSIRFYIDSGYLELAGKAIGELREEFGECEEIDGLVRHLKSVEEFPEPESEIAAAPTVAAVTNGAQPKGLGIDDLRSELGLDEVETADDSDYDTHYHTAVAYQEMGLLDEAIKEFQEAVGLVQPNDPTRRFFHCANLLGHCFMQKSMPNLALTWYQRALETPGLSDEEKQGIWYELASAYEADGDMENAGRYFEQVYAENIDFRDVSERVRNMAVSQ
jgi:tetratricopeptide (TPR) repeat protein